MGMGPMDMSRPWQTRDVVGSLRYLQRLWRLVISETTGQTVVVDAEPDEETLKLLHRTIDGVSIDYVAMAYNTAIAKLIVLTNHLDEVGRAGAAIRGGGAGADDGAAGAAHREEMWQRLGHSAVAGARAFPGRRSGAAGGRAGGIPDPGEGQGPVPDHGRRRRGAGRCARRAALAEPRIVELLDGAAPRKVVVVPGAWCRSFRDRGGSDGVSSDGVNSDGVNSDGVNSDGVSSDAVIQARGESSRHGQATLPGRYTVGAGGQAAGVDVLLHDPDSGAWTSTRREPESTAALPALTAAGRRARVPVVPGLAPGRPPPVRGRRGRRRPGLDLSTSPVPVSRPGSLGSAPTGGDYPCHLSVDPTGEFVVSANYGSGSLSVHPVQPDGSLGPTVGSGAAQGFRARP